MQTVTVAAGITIFGTFAAGDFLTNKLELRKLAAVAPSGWERKNMEIVLSTEVIRGQSGPATVVAAQFWQVILFMPACRMDSAATIDPAIKDRSLSADH